MKHLQTTYLQLRALILKSMKPLVNKISISIVNSVKLIYYERCKVKDLS